MQQTAVYFDPDGPLWPSNEVYRLLVSEGYNLDFDENHSTGFVIKSGDKSPAILPKDLSKKLELMRGVCLISEVGKK